MASTSTAGHHAHAIPGNHLSVTEDIDNDSIMTDEIDDDDDNDNTGDSGIAISNTLLSGTIDPSTLLYAGPHGASSTSGSPIASTSGTSGLASTSTTPSTAKASKHTSTSTSTSSSANIRPSGPVCEFGERLGYTYFSKPVPTAEELNTAHKHTETFWLTVDNDLTYLSFFRDTGPVSKTFPFVT